MSLRIETFDNARGGNTLYKALSHPWAARSARALLRALACNGPVAVYDPNGAIEAFDAIFGLDRIDIAETYVQQAARVGGTVLGRIARPVTELDRSHAPCVFVAAFDAASIIAQ